MTVDTGRVVTTTGPTDLSEIGITLTHEHLFANREEKFELPDSTHLRRIAHEPITLENLWYVRQNSSKHLDNLRLDPFEDAVHEATRYVRAGGDALVDVTPKNTGYDPEAARGVAEETGLNVVKGTAFYYRAAHPQRLAETSTDEIASEFVSDVRDGIGDTRVRAGIIGEIGMSTVDNHDGRTEPRPIHDQEKRVLRGAAPAALRTGASVSVHPPSHRDHEYPLTVRSQEILDICDEEGFPPDRVVICHVDQSKLADSGLTSTKRLADRDVFVEFDLFAQDRYMPDQRDAQPSDMDRVDDLVELVDAGYTDNLLLSHDVFLKYLISKYGGFGWTHILDNICPVLRDKGVSQETIDTILIENPRQLLTFEEPE